MDRRTAILVVLAFAIAGAGLMLLVSRTSDSGQESCAKLCIAKGMDYVYVPTGTTGRYIDGARNWSDSNDDCRCIPSLPKNGKKHPINRNLNEAR